jgi:hypothetical protein
MYGGFKRALFGHTSHPLDNESHQICLKQCWYSCKASGGRVIFDNHTQVTKLSAEINCLRWASALMGIVYDYIDQHIEKYGNPTFSVPRMKFVASALAMVDTNHETFMLEDRIEDTVDGAFVKYIGNGSAKPYIFSDADNTHRANFLAFCQHVQYLKTKGLTFIGDFQGTL